MEEGEAARVWKGWGGDRDSCPLELGRGRVVLPCDLLGCVFCVVLMPKRPRRAFTPVGSRILLPFAHPLPAPHAILFVAFWVLLIILCVASLLVMIVVCGVCG